MNLRRAMVRRGDFVSDADHHASAAQLQSTSPQVQPSPQELIEMAHRASEVVRLLDSLCNSQSAVMSTTSGSHLFRAVLRLIGGSDAGPSSTTMDVDTRAPKRPWEETQSSSSQPHAHPGAGTHSGSFPSVPTVSTALAGPTTNAERTAAEKDMELIRSKRALTTSLAAAAAAAAAGGGGTVGGASIGGGSGSTKNKYRKRSVSVSSVLFVRSGCSPSLLVVL